MRDSITPLAPEAFTETALAPHTGALLPQVQPLDIPERAAVPAAAGEPLPIDLDLLGSIAVKAEVMLGQVSLDIGTLMRMRQGEVISTDRLLSQPVDVLVNGKVMARGELVAVDDAFGVRITQVARQERA